MTSVSAIDPSGVYFSDEEFYRLQKARLITAIISLSFDFIAILVYLYLIIYYRDQVNRPSIRLAVFCCLANFLESVLFVVMIKTYGPSLFCFGAAVTSQYLSVLGVVLLTLIGVNLVLVYVVNVRRRHVLEYFYYPSALIYSFFGIIGPIVQHTKIKVHSEDISVGETCWYIDVIKSRYGKPLDFMWFYTCIFFATVVALLCSTIAIIKLMKDYRTLQNLFKSRRHVVSKQVPVYSQVVLRCLLYPIVPLVTNFCGFLAQCIIVSGVYPPYSLNFASNILHGLSGFFVALIFLNDPAITQIFSGWYNHWFYKHVIEYVLIETNHDQYIRVLDNDHSGNNNNNNVDDRAIVLVSFPPSKEKLKWMARLSFNLRYQCAMLTRCDSTEARQKQRSFNSQYDNDNRDNIVLGVDCPDATVEPSAAIKKEKITHPHLSTIPVRRLKLSSATVNQYIEQRYFSAYIILKRSFTRNITVEEAINGYSITIGDDDESGNYLLIPYTSVYYAKFIHWLLDGSIGRAFHTPSNVLIDVTITGESSQQSQYFRRRSQSMCSGNPVEEL